MSEFSKNARRVSIVLLAGLAGSALTGCKGDEATTAKFAVQCPQGSKMQVLPSDPSGSFEGNAISTKVTCTTNGNDQLRPKSIERVVEGADTAHILESGESIVEFAAIQNGNNDPINSYRAAVGISYGLPEGRASVAEVLFSHADTVNTVQAVNP